MLNLSGKKLRFFLFLSILFASFDMYGQTEPASSPGFKLFFEKVYLHLDRTYYTPGDDIWFKAYLVNAQNNLPFNTSNNLYVELIDPNSVIISKRIIRLDSSGVGDFQLGDSIAAGTYRVRAYTNWMRNFGSRFFFEREIQVTNIAGTSKNNPSANKPASVDKNTSLLAGYKIQFFPEGGTMVENVATLVSFKAEDASGRGVEASGKIVSDRGTTVASFKTTYLGMGSFSFTPKRGNQYKALVQYKTNSPVEASFPAVLPNGFVMNITGTGADSIVVNINSNTDTKSLHPSGIMTITARHAGKSYFKQEITLKDGKAVVSIPGKNFPAGIAYVTLYDENMHPHCERLVYIEHPVPLNVTVSADKSTYGPKEKATIHISVTDAQNRPVKTDLSMAVVDDRIIPPASGNIFTHLMLESDWAGKVENASAYFDKNNNDRFQQLDLLLRTQGWRSFLWRQLADTTIHISYLPEPGISISGRVTKPFSKKPMENMNITLFAPGAKGDKIYLTKTKADGKYYLDGLPLYGNQTIKLNTGDNIGKKAGAIIMDTMFSNPPAVVIKPAYITDSSAALNLFAAEAQKRWSKFRNGQWYDVLPEVRVKAKRSTLVLRDGSTAMNFGYPEYDFNITDKDYRYPTLRDFIVQKVPGAMYDEDLEGVNFLQNGKRVRPILIANKQEDVFGRLDYYSLSMQQINSVSVRHLVGSPSYNSAQGADAEEEDVSLNLPRGIRDFFLVTLSVKPGNADQQLSKLTTNITGYYEARIFYSPNYSTEDASREDNRITVHWAPLIKTDENGKASVSFYNADPKGVIRADVQGLTVNGIPVVATTKYEVK